MEKKFEKVFATYQTRYESILDVLYPAKNSTGFTERNLSVNFCTAYEENHPGSVTWYEFQFGENNNLHLDAMIINKEQKEILLVESKRFKNASKQVNAVERDISRIFSVRDTYFKEFAARIDDFLDYSIYGIVLADVWTKEKITTKGKLKKTFENGIFVSEHLKDLSLVRRLEEQCSVQYFVQRPRQLEHYYLISLVWNVH